MNQNILFTEGMTPLNEEEALNTEGGLLALFLTAVGVGMVIGHHIWAD